MSSPRQNDGTLLESYLRLISSPFTWSEVVDAADRLSPQPPKKKGRNMPSIDAAAAAWISGRVARRELTGITAEKYTYHLRAFAKFVDPETDVADITTQDIEAWLGTAKSRSGGPPAPRTVWTRAIPLKAMFGNLYDRKIIDEDPTKALGKIRQHELIPRRVSSEATARLLTAADFRQTVVILLCLHLGLRSCEVSRANIQDWSRAKREMLIHGKGGRERTMPIAGEAEEILGMWLDYVPGRRGPLFPTSQGSDDGRIGPQWVGQLVTMPARKAGVDVTAHQLRHTFASDLVDRGVPLPTVQKLLGHKSLATTTRYVVPDQESLRHHIVGRVYRRSITEARFLDEERTDSNHGSLQYGEAA